VERSNLTNVITICVWGTTNFVVPHTQRAIMGIELSVVSGSHPDVRQNSNNT
jgi:hypothetical protein